MSHPAPIETRYAGCRFRSRLEARWAVFFDRLGIEWQYEPQGCVVAGRPYLPDFWLPQQRLWVEVKGVLSHEDLITLLAATDLKVGLPRNPGGETPDAERNPFHVRLLVLGPIPEPGLRWTHPRLDAAAGWVLRQWVAFVRNQSDGWTALAIGTPMVFGTYDVIAQWAEQDTATAREKLLAYATYDCLTEDPELTAAYRAARSARFEHGESG